MAPTIHASNMGMMRRMLLFIERRRKDGHEQSEMVCMSQGWPLYESMSKQKEGNSSSLVSCLSGSGSVGFEDIRAWVVGSGSSRHMIGLRIILQGQPVVGSKKILDSWSVQVPGIIDCEASSSIVTRLS